MNKRVAHIIKPNHRNAIPNRFICFDTETTPTRITANQEVHKLRLGTATLTQTANNKKAQSSERIEFTTPTQFWAWVDRCVTAKTRLYVFAHNASFDLQVTDAFNQLKSLGYRLKTLIDECPPCIIEWANGVGTIVALDTLNYVPMNLATLGSKMGRDKLKMPDYSAKDAEWLAYCWNDTEIITEFVTALVGFIRSEDLGNFKYTAAGQAYNAFRHRFMRDNIFIHTREKALALERQAYYGGRTEAFFIGSSRGDYTLLDINSMYPSVMLSNPYPTKLICLDSRSTVKQLTDGLKECLAVAHVRLKTNRNIYPLRYGGRLCFPTGNFETTLTTPELLEALSHNEIEQVKEVAWYDHAKLFETFVTTLYAKRQQFEREHNKPFALLCKLMLNSLYGKFGQRHITWDNTSSIPDNQAMYFEELDATTLTLKKYRNVYGLPQIRTHDSESYESMPAIAAHVTAYARLLLSRLMIKTGVGNYLYCDTDSILVNPMGLENLRSELDDAELGKLKVVKTVSEVEIRGLKDYRLDNETKTKGVSAKAVRLSENEYRQPQFRGLRAAIRSGQPDSQLVTDVTKLLKREYLKGTVTPSGWVEPFRL